MKHQVVSPAKCSRDHWESEQGDRDFFSRGRSPQITCRRSWRGNGSSHPVLTEYVLRVCVFFKAPPAAAAAPAATVKFEGLTKSSRMKVKWTQLGLVFFLVLSLVMTGCFFWQYQLPKVLQGEYQHTVSQQVMHHVAWGEMSSSILLLSGEQMSRSENSSGQIITET